MANVQHGNSFYVDATGVLETKAVRVVGVILTATSAGAVILLKDAADTYTKADLRTGTSGESLHFNFTDTPIHFPNGLMVKTLTNAVATIIYTS